MPNTIKKASDRASESEVAKATGQIPTNLQERTETLGDTRTEVKDTFSNAEAAPELTGLARFKFQFENLQPEHKASCTWQEVETRLTANDGHYLKLAEAMNQGGILFGVDKNGNPLIADAGRPIMMNMQYPDAATAVEGRKTPTGYEMFPFSHNSEKSDEIKAYEASTGEPIVKGSDVIWLESGNDNYARVACFVPEYGRSDVRLSAPYSSNPNKGVLRLLRVKKAK